MVATILILALTVVLFSSIFFFIQAFPKPVPQPADLFRSSLGVSGAAINSLTITYLIGPALGSQTQIYAQSQGHPGAIKPCCGLPYYQISAGLPGKTVWQTGQTWTVSLASFGLTLPDNITVTILTSGTLLFRTTLPGLSPFIPPVFPSFGTSPTSPYHGSKFSINVQVQDGNPVRWVNITLTGIPGYTPTTVAMTANGTGIWSYTVPAGKTTGATLGATYYAVVVATDSVFQSGQVVVPVVFR